MSTPHKSTRTPRTAAETAETVDNFVPLYTKNVERLADLQKKTLELAAEQSAELLDAWKKAFRVVPEAPGLFWFDLFGQTFERFVETQKEAIDLAVEQSHAVAELAKERGTSVSKAADGVTTMFQQTVERSVAAQKKALEFYAEQQKTAYETAKKQFRITNPFADAFQSGLDVLLETQKSVLEIASKPIKHAAAA
jgi:hypothetical protein